VHGVPASGVTSVVLNVTATAPTTAGHLTVYPSGAAVPTASTLNFAAGRTVPDNAGQTKTFTGLDEQPFTVTSNSTLSASGFKATPNLVNSWWQNTPFRISMKVSGAQDGVAAIRFSAFGSCAAQSTTPTHEPDGSYSVPALMYQSGDGSASGCALNAVVIADGAGDMAVYGDQFGAPDPGLKVTGVLNAVAPTVTSAALNVTTVKSSRTGQQSVYATVHVTQGTAPVDESDSHVYDSTGKEIYGGGGGADVGPDGTMMVDMPLPYGLAPGTYTLGFSVVSRGRLRTSYGEPGGTPVPGGPLALTVTAG